MSNYAKRVLFYWLAFGVSYVFPFLYFLIKLGITQQKTTIVIPVIIIGLMGILRLSSDIPKWVGSWKPSFGKGLIKAIPKILLFIILITLGLALKTILAREIELKFAMYFETVLVLFGGIAVGSVIEAFHLKYKELDLIAKGYVLGVVNK